MPTREVLHIDRFKNDREPGDAISIPDGSSIRDVLKQLGAVWRIEREEYVPKARELSAEAAAFLADYKYEEAGSVLAVFWRYHSLEAEEFDTVEEAERFLEGSAEYGNLAGEAIVDGDQKITVLD